MPVLRVDLLEGFRNDTVVVTIDGRPVATRTATTRLSASIADSFEVQTSGGTAHIEVAIPNRELREGVEIDPVAFPYLGVTLAHGRVVLEPSREPFRNM